VTEEEYLAIPYVMAIEPVQAPGGDWICRAEYPELGCAVEAASVLVAIDELEAARERYIRERLQRAEPIPVPRSPLSPLGEPLDPRRPGAAG
jgi:hypothetical protein